MRLAGEALLSVRALLCRLSLGMNGRPGSSGKTYIAISMPRLTATEMMASIHHNPTATCAQ